MNTRHPDAELIDRLGGAAKVARELGLTSKHATQLVSNWKTRGIPEIWRYRRPDLFKEIEVTGDKAA